MERRKVTGTAKRAPGDNVLPDQFQTVAAVLPSDWAEKHKKFSGTNQKSERRRPFGTGLVRHCPQGPFSPFFTFLRALFSARLDFPSPHYLPLGLRGWGMWDTFRFVNKSEI